MSQVLINQYLAELDKLKKVSVDTVSLVEALRGGSR